MQSIEFYRRQYIRMAASESILAGGTEALSHSPLLFSANPAAKCLRRKLHGRAQPLPPKLAAMLALQTPASF